MSTRQMLIFIIICINFLSGAKTVKYSDYQAFRLLDFGIGARAIGMGNAVVVSTNDVYSIYWNPARLAALKGTNISASYLNNPLGEDGFPSSKFTKPQMAFIQSIGSYGTVGLSGYFLDTGDIKYLFNYERVDSIPKKQLREYLMYNEGLFVLSYANEITSDFGLGVNLKCFRVFLPETSESYLKSLFDFDKGRAGILIDLGSYLALTPQMTLGLFYQSGTSFVDSLLIDTVAVVDTATGDTIEVKPDTTERRIPIISRAIFGIAYEPIKNLLIELDIKMKKAISPFMLYLGSEYSLCPFSSGNTNCPISFKFRIGARNLLGREQFKDNESVYNADLTAGAGINFASPFIEDSILKGSFEYALIHKLKRPYVVDSDSHIFSFGVGINF